jgi:predicted nucleotidyltransferase component of viral defense system
MNKDCFPEKGWAVLASLKGIFTKHHAVLAGGTALALQIGHRISVDLDFFTTDMIRPESVISAVRKTGLPFRVLSEGEDFVTLEVDGVKVSLFSYDYPFLQKVVAFEGIRIAGLLDIAAMKLVAISQRGTKRDFIDLYCILQEIPFHLIADHTVKRFGRERINPLHIGKSLVYFSDAESHPDPEFIKGKSVKWEAVKKFFRQRIKQLVLDLDNAVRGGAI